MFTLTFITVIVFVSVRFVGGKLNMCYNAVDRHVESGRGQQPAIIYDSPVTGIKQIITFRELQDQVKIIFKSRSHRIRCVDSVCINPTASGELRLLYETPHNLPIRCSLEGASGQSGLTPPD